MNKSIIIILLVTVLDAIGIGLIMPVLPTLLNEFVSENRLANHYGILLALYATMQVIFAPILGKLSDKYGRKPILLFSLLGAALDYLLMACSTSLWMLYIGRIIAGITGATGAVCASAMTDVTHPHERTRYFGFLGGAFGVGLIIGPMLGDYWVRSAPIRHLSLRLFLIRYYLYFHYFVSKKLKPQKYRLKYPY